jgi:carbon storage regulator
MSDRKQEVFDMAVSPLTLIKVVLIVASALHKLHTLWSRSIRRIAMLVLTRRVGESLTIKVGDTEIRFVALGVDGNQMKVGVDAPRDVQILRDEVTDRNLANGNKK